MLVPARAERLLAAPRRIVLAPLTRRLAGGARRPCPAGASGAGYGSRPARAPVGDPAAHCCLCDAGLRAAAAAMAADADAEHAGRVAAARRAAAAATAVPLQPSAPAARATGPSTPQQQARHSCGAAELALAVTQTVNATLGAQ